jgi:hypothetical protein
VKELFERALASCVEDEGPDGINVSNANQLLGQFYSQRSRAVELPSPDQLEGSNVIEIRKEHLNLSILHFQESVRIYTKVSNTCY